MGWYILLGVAPPFVSFCIVMAFVGRPSGVIVHLSGTGICVQRTWAPAWSSVLYCRNAYADIRICCFVDSPQRRKAVRTSDFTNATMFSHPHRNSV
jgi:hypothetical protein